MKRILFLFLILCCFKIKAQHPDVFFQKGMKKFDHQDYSEALFFFTQYINAQKEKSKYEAFYFSAMAYLKLKMYEQADSNLVICIDKKPKDLSLYTIRAFVKKGLTNYDEALQSFNFLIANDKYNMEAYFNRGVIYTYMQKYDSACLDFKMSKNVIEASNIIVEKFCNNDNVLKEFKKINHIVRLTRKTKDKSYGYDASNPIKVGAGIFGAAANEHAYLDLLRDTNNIPVSYERLGKCCPHKSFIRGEGLYYLDKFEITYTDIDKKKKVATLLFSHEEYASPMIPYNLKTIPFVDSLTKK